MRGPINNAEYRKVVFQLDGRDKLDSDSLPDDRNRKKMRLGLAAERGVPSAKRAQEV